MKCVKNEGGLIIRVSDKDAEKLTSSDKFEFCSKEEWKNAGRKYLKDIRSKKDE